MLRCAAVCLAGFGMNWAALGMPYDLQTATLGNGLGVVTLEDRSAPIVAVQVWYHVGSKNEKADRQGFAHMFEHMMFRGTDRLGPEDHFNLVRGKGGYVNAFTSFDFTAYVNTLPSNQLDLALWLEAERMMFLRINAEGFETERRVVEEERRQILNRPYGTVFERILPVLFTVHPYQWSAIGRIPQLRAASVDELQGFWDRFYVPNNALLVVVGDVDHETAVARADQYFGWMPKLPEAPRVTIEEPAQTAPREVVIREQRGPAPMVDYAYRGVPARNPDRMALELLLDILGQGESSRLYRDLVKDRQIAQDTYASLYALEQDGIMDVGALLAPGPDASLDDALQALDEHVAAIQEGGVTSRELEKAKNQRRRGLVTEALTVEDKAQLIGETWILHGDVTVLNRRLEELDAVTTADVQRVAQTYLVPERRTTVRVVPDPAFQYDEDMLSINPPPDSYTPTDNKADVARPESIPVEPPENALLESLPIMPASERSLGNGLKVVVVPNDEAPFVTMTLGLKYGAFAESPDRPGAANLALDMLTKGTENYTAAELAETLEYNAIQLGGSAEMDVAEVSASAVSGAFPLALELLAEVVLRPTFPADELAIVKNQAQTSLAIREQDPGYLAGLELNRALYGNHPYARPDTGSSAEVAQLDREALLAWWTRFARPDAAVLYVAGDVTPEDVFAAVEKALGSWDAQGPAPEVALPPYPETSGRHIYIVDRPGAVQSQIRVGQRSITRGHPYYHASRVFTEVFGGGFNSRLNEVVRVQRGLTYGAHGYFAPKRFNGEFLVQTFTQTPTTGETVQAVLEVIESMRTEPPSEAEVHLAKSNLTGSFARGLETPQDTVAYQWLIEYNGLPEDYLQQAMAGYKATTVDDLQHIATSIIDVDALTIVVTGDAEAVRPQLEGIAPVTVVGAESLVPAAEDAAP